MKSAQGKRYEKNITWLKQNSPHLSAKIAAWQFDQTEVAVQQTLMGWNAQISVSPGSAFCLHSLFEREREYKQITAAIDENHATVVLFGCGSGDFLKWVNKHYQHIKHLVIVEPSVNVFRAFLQQWYLPDILSIFPKVSLVVGEKQTDAGEWLKKVVYSEVQEERIAVIVSLINYHWNYPEYEKEMHKALIELLRYSTVNRNTLDAYRNHWLVNLWHNLQYGNADIADFMECFRGKPAIIVSAGPSLDKNIHLLKEAKDKALVVAVGSAISILHKENIKPHLRVALDQSPLAKEIFAGTYEDGVPLVYCNQLNFNILKNYSGPVIHTLLGNVAGLEDYLIKKAEVPHCPVGSGFSVANVTANLLVKWKCNPIVFVGQDLAYTENRLHATGAWDNEFEEKYMRKMHVYKDIFGNDVYSDPAFDGMRQTFELTIFRNPDLQFLNATEGGIPIDGAPNHKLAELLTTWRACEQPETVIDNVLKALQQNGIAEDRRKKLYDAAMAVKEDVEEYVAQIKVAKNEIELLLQKGRLTDKEAKHAASVMKKFKEPGIYQIIQHLFVEAFAFRREGYLKNNGEKILPQIRLFYLEMNEILEYLELMLKLIGWYERGEEFKVVYE
ncbi:MAG: hypothetical protein H6Q72_2835 [Firmicutes bacterium]|nr:hypothetical protein [Bacillota bacterium]